MTGGKDPVAQVGLGAAGLGFALGVLHGAWQVSVESAQVLAGLVSYPPTNPFYLYHLKLWTIVNQLAALMLKLGASEVTASYVVSGLLGAVSFAALALVVYALTEERLLALATPFFIHLTPAPQYGVSYPIWLLGVSHTYGVLGLSWDLLVLALLGCGRYRVGLFLFGLAPAVHPSLAVWLWIIVGTVAATHTPSRLLLLARWRWLAAGLAVSVVSFLAQLPGILSIPKPSEDVTPYFDAFVRNWDGHRQPIDFGNDGVWVSFATGLCAAWWLARHRDHVPEAARFLLRAFAAGSGIAAILIALTWGRGTDLPRVLLVLMPNRLLNVNVLASTAALVALLWVYRRSAWGAAGLLVLAAGLVVGYRSRYLVFAGLLTGSAPAAAPFGRLQVLALAALLLVIAAARWRRDAPEGRRLSTPLALTAAALLFAAPLVAFTLGAKQGSELHRPRPNRALAKLAQGHGLIAPAASLHMLQLRTRRPVILEGGGLDLLPYVREVAPEMNRILKRVYGLDLFDLPPSARRTSMIPDEHNRRVWQARSTEEWRAIRRDFDVREVVTPRDWDLELPLVERTHDYLLYYIPETP